MSKLSARVIIGFLCGWVGASQGWSIWWTLAFAAAVYTLLVLIEIAAERLLRWASAVRVPL